jgi:Thrombospondin type 3 repeat
LSGHELRISISWTGNDPAEHVYAINVCLVDGAGAEVARTGAHMHRVSRTFLLDGPGFEPEPPRTAEEDLIETVDNDGRPDGQDNCRTVANPGQEDTNNDGIGDACAYDHDADGVVDPRDNCPPRFPEHTAMSNPDQRDTDADGLGDVCDGDDDDDYLLDGADNCPLTWNQDQADADGDGLGAACDANDSPAPSPPASAPTDITAPTIEVALGRTLRLRELGRSIAVEVRCNERCSVRAELLVKRKRVAAGTASLGGRGTTYVFMRRLARLRPAKAILRLTATDAAGNVRRASRRIQLRR